MPQWGRPQGAKGSKRRKQWGREQMYEERVVEELDSDDTDTQGVGLALGKRFSSDPLRFTGTDLATRSRKSYIYQSGEASETSSESEGENTDVAQDVLREKEEELVQSALGRIRRAQEKGKAEVKLNPEELEALEKRRKRMQAAATTKARKGSGSSGGSDREKRRRSRTISVPIAAPLIAEQSRPTSRQRAMSRSKARDEIPSQSHPAGGAPGMLIQGMDGVTYAPLGYYPPQAGSHRNSPTRPRSATYQQRMGPPPTFEPGARYFSEGAPAAVGHGSNRHLSDGARPASSSSNGSRRPLPDEHEWVPTNSRRNSVARGPVDPFEYQVESDVPPIPQQYIQVQNYHNYSAPSDVAYSSVRRNFPAGYSAAARVPSDPAVRRSSRKDARDELGDEESSEAEEDESNDDDLGNGVQVYVEPEPEKEKPVPRKPVGGKKKGKR